MEVTTSFPPTPTVHLPFLSREWIVRNHLSLHTPLRSFPWNPTEDVMGSEGRLGAFAEDKVVTVYGYVSLFECHVCAHVRRGQKRVLDSLELELQSDVSCLPWVLGSELRSSGRAASPLDCLRLLLS